MPDNIYSLFARHFPADTGRLFLETGDGRRYSYSDLEAESARHAALLRGLGLQPGERVAVQVEKSPQVLFLYLGCLRAGLVYLPLNTAYTESELAYFLEDATPSLLVCDPARLERAQALAQTGGVTHVLTLDTRGKGTLSEAAARQSADFYTVARDADDLAVILYTSGTTGRPKGAMISHGNLASNGLALHRYWQWRPDDVLLHALPIFHIHGLFVACHCVLLNGSAMIFLERFDVDTVLRFLPRATVMMGVPTFYTRLLANSGFGREPCRNMRLFISGSAPLLEQTFNEFRERTGHTILERYGMTETGMNPSNPVDGPRLAGTVGLPLPGVSLRIVDEANQPVTTGDTGSLQVRGDNVFRGYWNKPDKTAEEFTADGYFKTGDLALQDENGYVQIVGRGKDLVISGGLNVYPREVEFEIDQLPGVRESAVIGVPHPDFGEAVVAIVVRDGDSAISSDDVITRLKTKLANFKVPKRVEFMDTLPRNTMGKVQKNNLREQYQSMFSV